MKILALLALFLVLSGCAAFQRPLPPWARPMPVAASPTPTASSTGLGSVTAPPTPDTTPAAPAHAPAVPPPVTPPAPPTPDTAPAAASAPAAPARSPAPPPVTSPTPPAAPAAPPPIPSPALTANLPPAEMRRLQDEAQRRIEEAERLLRQLDGRPLAPKDLETLRLAQSLVEQARKALGGQEYERAANLAAKARTLADDLSTRR